MSRQSSFSECIVYCSCPFYYQRMKILRSILTPLNCSVSGNIVYITTILHIYRFLSCQMNFGVLETILRKVMAFWCLLQAVRYKFRTPALMQKQDVLVNICIFRAGMCRLADPSASLANHFSYTTQKLQVLSENQRPYLKNCGVQLRKYMS